MAAPPQYFDSIALAAVVAEIGEFADARIDKVGQPSATELYLQLRVGGKNHKLYINLRERWARMHLTTRPLGNLPVPAAFTMLLRKHLEGSRLLRVVQPGLERVAYLYIAGRDELGDPFERVLVIELIGKYANMFLVQPRPPEPRDATAAGVQPKGGEVDGGPILGCMRSVTEAMCQARQLGTGLPYDPPPVEGDRPTLRQASDDMLAAILASALAAEKPARLVDRLCARIAGVGKSAVGQLLVGQGLDPALAADDVEAPELVVAALRAGREALATRTFAPRQAPGPGWEYNVWPTGEAQGPASEVLDAYYGRREDDARLAERRARVAGKIKVLLDRHRTRLSDWEATLARADEADGHREQGELLTAHIHLAVVGAKTVDVPDFFAEGMPDRTIPLDPALSAAANAQRFFKRYQKARNGRQAALTLLEGGRQELAYLEQVATAIAQAEATLDLQEIEDELSPPAPVRGKGGRGAPAKDPAPLKLTSSDGWVILVGKNNRQNEHVTFKLARPFDVWLHARELPGSHVVVQVPERAEAIPDRTLQEAAALAAHYSQGREAGRVTVIYTRKKHVRKQPGGKPGMVHYEGEKAIVVAPDDALVRSNG